MVTKTIPAVIFIKVLKSSVEMLLSVHPVHVHSCSDELIVVYRPITISIGLLSFPEFEGARDKVRVAVFVNNLKKYFCSILKKILTRLAD